MPVPVTGSSTVQAPAPTRWRTVYQLAPATAFQVSGTCEFLPAVPASPVGVAGGGEADSGVAVTDEEYAEFPAALVARTWNSYSEPLASPETVVASAEVSTVGVTQDGAPTTR